MIQRLKRSNGTVYYKNLETGKFSSRSEFYAQAPVDRDRWLVGADLSKKEKLSKHDHDKRITYNGRFISNRKDKQIRDDIQKADKEITQRNPEETTNAERLRRAGNDLKKAYGEPGAKALLNRDRSYYANTQTSTTFNAYTTISNLIRSGKEFTYTAAGGQTYTGSEAMERLMLDEQKALDDDGGEKSFMIYRIEEFEDGFTIDFSDGQLIASD